MPRMVYAGAPCYLTPCEWLGNSKASFATCLNGQCKGMIEGNCPFYNVGGVIPKYEGFFAEVKEVP